MEYYGGIANKSQASHETQKIYSMKFFILNTLLYVQMTVHLFSLEWSDACDIWSANKRYRFWLYCLKNLLKTVLRYSLHNLLNHGYHSSSFDPATFPFSKETSQITARTFNCIEIWEFAMTLNRWSESAQIYRVCKKNADSEWAIILAASQKFN